LPRGGGSRGTRIGGFSSGGFRGGGFRGSPASFRTSTIRSSGRPFGRTGATRITSRSPSGPYRHSYYRPRRRYYGYYGYPWYRRFWYSPYWSGYYYRPWYYSPAYIGGGIIIAILLALIILPIAGVAFAFPFDNADSSGIVNYRSTEILYYNEYWYEYEFIKAGQEIEYSVQSSPTNISFAIWDQPFENLPTTTKQGGDMWTFENIQQNDYRYWTIFLRPGSLIDYSYNASDEVDFFISDGYNLILWNSYENPTFFREENNKNQSSGTLTISEAKDYYLVWYNEDSNNIDVTYDVNYTATNIIDFSVADINYNSTDIITTNTFTVPNDGEWYFFIYFDPMSSLDESTQITFDVTYKTGIISQEKWISIQPILITIIVIIAIIILAAYFARKSQKKLKEKKMGLKTKTKSVKKEVATKVQKVSPEKSEISSKQKCLRCGAELKPNAKFCHVCGGKVEGRKIGSSSKITPSESNTCVFCGNKIKSSDKFCTYCGTKIADSNN